ncbi:hypothetical protein M011DRAFT_467083 [Sporormia fimetaria CBS 119925]|uniref:Uncharacterized protein n=1 Tax=Sporormia fimetaria CBS 119925 TaxID=1340428 RepID=A0A6A6VBP5_9PLEO|nr:hypothetical protein M011DRAFT_467083 [Sporormia fimetaria CBS 119925]
MADQERPHSLFRKLSLLTISRRSTEDEAETETMPDLHAQPGASGSPSRIFDGHVIMTSESRGIPSFRPPINPPTLPSAPLPNSPSGSLLLDTAPHSTAISDPNLAWLPPWSKALRILGISPPTSPDAASTPPATPPDALVEPRRLVSDVRAPRGKRKKLGRRRLERLEAIGEGDGREGGKEEEEEESFSDDACEDQGTPEDFLALRIFLFPLSFVFSLLLSSVERFSFSPTVQPLTHHLDTSIATITIHTARTITITRLPANSVQIIQIPSRKQQTAPLSASPPSTWSPGHRRRQQISAELVQQIRSDRPPPPAFVRSRVRFVDEPPVRVVPEEEGVPELPERRVGENRRAV